MLKEYLLSRPLLPITILMIIGIAIGRMAGIPFFIPYHYGITAIIILIATAALWRYEHIASILVIALMLFTGAYLIKQHDNINPPQRYTKQTSHANCLTPVRDQIFNEYSELGLDGDILAITSAMTLGDKHLITKETKETYAITGASHVFALSGLHLGIIFMLLSVICRPTKRIAYHYYNSSPGIFRTFSAITHLLPLPFIWLYAIMVGAHASVIRAAVMITVYALCRLMTRKTGSLEVLCLTAFLLLTINPQWLFDIGFQMSFLAVAGIATLYPPIYRLMPRKLPTIIKYLWGLFCVSLTAQIATAPIIAYYFGRLSVYGLLTNYIVSPLAFIIIIGTAILLITHSTMIAEALTTTIGSQTKLLEAISNFPHATISIRITLSQTILIYIIIITTAIIIAKIIKSTKTVLL